MWTSQIYPQINTYKSLQILIYRLLVFGGAHTHAGGPQSAEVCKLPDKSSVSLKAHSDEMRVKSQLTVIASRVQSRSVKAQESRQLKSLLLGMICGVGWMFRLPSETFAQIIRSPVQFAIFC